MMHASQLVISVMCSVMIPVAGGDVCGESIVCKQLKANGMTFDCRLAGENGTSGDVMFLHGFPERAKMYDEVMRQLAKGGFRSLACDQRGYSPGASPNSVDDYLYSLLRDDIFALADAQGFKQFHLVGHDHGATLGWFASASSQGKDRLLSYVGMSVPHLDAFAAGLYGPDEDEEQQIASQYFSMFMLNNSASLNSGSLYHAMGAEAGFKSAADFQKALWWYNGAVDAGVLAVPKQFSAWELMKKGNSKMAALRKAFGINKDLPIAGTPQRKPIGDVSVPCLYVCGSTDTPILCSKPYALKTKNFCKASYQYLEVDCGHEVLGCAKEEETSKVIKGITQFVASAAATLV